MTTQILGNFREKFPNHNYEFLILGFSSHFIPIQKRWKNNGLSADFVSDYMSTFFPDYDKDDQNTKIAKKIIESVNYITNELLENALKYNDNNCTDPIQFALHLFEEKALVIILEVSNILEKKKVENFQNFIKDLLQSDPEEFYLTQLEKSAENENSTGIGLVSMRNDYDGKLGWKFEDVASVNFEVDSPIQSKTFVKVTTMVELEYTLNGVFV
jgi:hypothetical protein